MIGPESWRTATRTRALGVSLWLGLVACSERPGTREAAEHMTRHDPRFRAVERWFLRALATETVPADRGTFEGRIFAVVDGDEDVVEAWLARTGTAPLSLSAHGTPPMVDDDRMTVVRTPDGRELRVGYARLDDPATARQDEVDVVLLERRSRPSDTESVSVAVAFRR